MYVRKDNRLKLEERKINSDTLDNVIKKMGIEKATTVTTGYGSTYREVRNNTIGYGKNYAAFYFDFKDNIVEHIWLTNSFGIDKIKLAECLFEIGQFWNLLLVDWTKCEIVNLKDKAAIEKYLDV